MRLLFVGDVVGRSGRNAISDILPGLIADYALDLVVVNGENAAGGFGITEEICQDFLDAGADVVTTGNHVWDQRDKVFGILRDALVPGGSVVIWEPRWPDEVASLREPRKRPLAFQNLSEHVQGNHFLRPAEIEAAMRDVGLSPQTFLFADGTEAVVVGRRER